MTNQLTVIGLISSQYIYDHELYGEKYYRVTLSIERISGIFDYIPMIISERLIDITKDYTGQCVGVKGQFRSHRLNGKLILFIFATSIELLQLNDNVNDLFLEGYIVKPPVYRETPLGREITDILLRVNRAYDKYDYIPCIAWGRAAYYAGSLNENDHVRISGRVQSREYNKAGEIKTAYEVSVNLIEKC